MKRWWAVTVAATALGAAAWWWLGRVPDAPLTLVDDASGEESAPAATPVPALQGRRPLPPREVAVAGGAAVRGVVADEKGMPLADVLVEAFLPPAAQRPKWGVAPVRTTPIDVPAPWPPPLATTRSGPDGRFRLEGLDPAGTWTFRARPAPPLVGTSTSLHRLDGPPREVRLEVRAGSPVRGRVIDAEGRGVRAWVNAYGTLREATWSLPPTATEADGRFALDAVPLGVVTFGASVPGRAARTGVAVRVPPAGEVEIRIEEPAGATIEGRVVDLAGAPVAGAQVVASTMGDAAPLVTPGATGAALTTADGAFRIAHLLPGRVSGVTAQAPGYLASPPLLAQVEVAEGQTLRLEIQLARGATLQGTVRSANGGVVAGATVSVHYWRRQPYLQLDAQTDAAGAYRIEGLALGTGQVGASAEGYYLPGAGGSGPFFPGVAPVQVTATEEGQVVQKDLTLQAGVPVAGRVVDEAGAGVAGATVTAGGTPNQRRMGRGYPITATSAADGTFAFAGLEPSPDWVFSARTETLASEPTKPTLVDANAPPLALSIVLRPAASISGRVVDGADRPLAMVGVTLTPGGLTTTDANGAFSMRGLAAGTYTVSLPWRRSALPPETRQVAWGQEVTDVVLRLPDTAGIDGVVVDEKGNLLPGVRVSAYSKDREWSETATSVLDGGFRFLSVPDGEYGLRAGDSGDETVVAAGATGVRVTWKRAPKRRALEGTVLDPDGRPVAAAQLMVWFGPKENRTATGAQVWGGRFHLALPAAEGLVDMHVTGARDAADRAIDAAPLRMTDVDPSAGPVELRLEKGLTVSGRVVDPAGAPAPDVAIRAHPKDAGGRVYGMGDPWDRPASVTDREGRFRVVGLTAGEVWIIATPPGEVPPARVLASTGQDEVVVRLAAGNVLEGVVHDPAGQPVVGALVTANWSGDGSPGPGMAPGNRSATTLSDGAFRLAGLPDAPVSLYVQPARGMPDPQWPWLPTYREKVRSDSKHLRIVLVAGVRIEGTVVDADGRPARGGHVNVMAVDPSGAGSAASAWAEIGQDGRFSVGPVAATRYHVYANGADGGQGAPLEVTAPATAVRVTLSRASALSVRVVGTGLEGFTATFLQKVGTSWNGQGQGVPSSGHVKFTLSSDEEGALLVRKEGDPRVGFLDRVRPGGGTVTVSLEEGLAIDGRVEGFPPGGRMTVECHDDRGVTARCAVAADGTFAVRALPPGLYRILAGVVGGTVAPIENVAAGTRGVTLTFVPGRPSK